MNRDILYTREDKTNAITCQLHGNTRSAKEQFEGQEKSEQDHRKAASSGIRNVAARASIIFDPPSNTFWISKQDNPAGLAPSSAVNTVRLLPSVQGRRKTDCYAALVKDAPPLVEGTDPCSDVHPGLLCEPDEAVSAYANLEFWFQTPWSTMSDRWRQMKTQEPIFHD